MKRGQGGFTLVEVVVSLVIVAGAMIPLLTILGQAGEDVLYTTEERKLRSLMQIILADVELGPLTQEEAEEEAHEEGDSGDFAGFGSVDDPDEYAGYEWNIEVFREEIVLGGADENTLAESGFDSDASGRILGRPISSDSLSEAEQEKEPEGEIKRVLVLSVRRLGETSDTDRVLRVMTYLPNPGEEERDLAGGAGGEGGGRGDGAAAGGGDTSGRGGATSPAPTGGGGRK